MSIAPSLLSQLNNHPKHRTHDTGHQVPSFGRIVKLVGRALRVKCPNCGKGPVLNRSKFDVLPRCPCCNFRYMRSDDHYFSAPMFFNLMIMEAIFAGCFALYLILKWPNINWDMITYTAAIGMLLLGIIMQPLGKVFWLTFDVLIRPVSAEECIG